MELGKGAGNWPPDVPVRILHTRLDLRVDPRARTVRGTATHSVRAVIPGQRRLALQLVELEVSAVRLDGVAVPFHHEGGDLAVFLPRALPRRGTAEVAIDYAGSPRAGLNFTGDDAAGSDGPPQAWSQGQHEYARYWFPTHDYPNQKQTTELVVDAPAAFEVVSNGALVSVARRGAWRRWHWRQAVPHAAYLVSLVVGEFETWDDEVDGIPLRYYVPPGRVAEGRRCFGETPAMIRALGDLAGTRYPFEKYASVVVRDFTWGGMENTSATTFNDRVLVDELGALETDPVALATHELGHQWFGDYLTCHGWEHSWLNEGFATFCWPYYAERSRGIDEAERIFIHHADNAVAAEQGDPRAAVSRDYEEAFEVFDSRIYDRGAWVLRMLRHMLGDQLFHDAIHEYVRRHAGGLVTTEDLVRAVEDVTGDSLGWFFDQWVRRPGVPDLEVRYRWDAGAREAVVDVRQRQAVKDLLKVYRGQVRLAFGVGDGVVEHGVRLGLSGPDDSFAFRLRREPAWVRFDRDNSLLKSLDFERPDEMLAAQLRDDNLSGRVEAARQLGRSGGEEARKALDRALRRDGNWFVRATAAGALGAIGGTEAATMLRRALSQPDSRVRIAACGALAGWVKSAEVGTALVDRVRTDPSNGVVATAAASLGAVAREASIELLHETAARPSPNEQVAHGALAGLAATRSPEAMPHLLEAAERGRSWHVRAAGLGAAAQLASALGGETLQEARRVAVAALRDGHHRVRGAACGCLAGIGEAADLPELRLVIERDLEATMRSAARATIRAIESGATRRSALDGIRGGLDEERKLQEDLRRRLRRLEVVT